MATHSNPKCKKCKYRAGQQAHHGCDYFFITGKLRGGKVSDCQEFKAGGKIKTTKILTLV
jgi:hypothetical protein